MHSNLELAATLKGAMRRKNLKREDLALALGVSSTMIAKILCGDVVPSQHLEKQMIEVLEIPERRVRRVSAARGHKSKEKMSGDEKAREAA